MAEKCEKCGESFKSEEALEQHLEDYDHSKNEGDQPGLKERFMTSNLAGISIIAVLIIGIGFLGVSVLGSSGGSGGTVTVDVEGEPYIGSANASTTIAYFGDYNCSACLYFEQNIFSSLQDQVVGEDVKFVKKNFPVINEQSPQLAQASESVWSQTNSSNREVFWEWHAKMYDNQGGYGSGWATIDNIVELSNEVEGVDAEQVREDIESGEFNSETREDQRQGQAAGVKGTPTFVIFNEDTGDSTSLVGPQPVSEFRTAISSVSS